MNYFNKTFLGLFLVLGIMLLSTNQSKACDRSRFTLDSLVFNAGAGNYTVYAQLCMGGGVLGASAGANEFTDTFGLAAYGGSGTIIGFTPPFITSDSTGCTFAGGLAYPPTIPSNASGTPDPASAFVAFSPTAFGCLYTCVSSTAICGQPHEDCNQIVLTLSDLPDSITAIGIEGQGNPALGCHRPIAPGYDDNITIDFSTLPVVWGGFNAAIRGEGVDLNWVTNSETNNSHFLVMRADENGTWDEIHRIDSEGDTDEARSYSWTDYNPFRGVNQYRITQVDIDAKFTQTEVRTVNFNAVHAFGWRNIGPVPTHNLVQATFAVENAQSMDYQIISMNGEMVHSGAIEAKPGINELRMDLSDYADGVYFLRLRGTSGTLQHKLIKI